MVVEVVAVSEAVVVLAAVVVEVADSTESPKLHLRRSSVRSSSKSFSHSVSCISIELGSYSHPCENQLVCNATNDMIPYFNAGIFLENKQQIGKVDEILGPIKQYVWQ